MTPDYHAPAHCLDGKVILVTGGGTGLGREAALAYASLGATLLLLGRREDALSETYDAILAAGGAEPAMFPFDLAAADDSGFERLAQTLTVHFRRLDGILHSAAKFYSATPLALQSLEQWQTLFKTNLFAAWALTRACLPLLQAAPAASVIFTGDDHGAQPAAYWGGYAISKAGLHALTRIWAQELRLQPQIRINTLIPGQVDSPLRRRTHPGEDASQRPAMRDLMPWYTWLMGPDSASVHGEIITCAPGIR
jgi:NAD(P)-dependent dehydrogenase (short-subunit alcohol dehydrogenase family)